ncbi:protein MON2 homolog [Artemia franciscana]|uniref:protein MON2 homolog n=1 Tax=Artemia franciscana TaxID=6661 RepID=UPI0032DA1921
MILSTYPAVFFSHPEFVFLLKERVCALVIKLFSPNVKHQSRSSPAQQAASQDKPYYPVSLRLLRLVTVLVQKYYKILVSSLH